MARMGSRRRNLLVDAVKDPGDADTGLEEALADEGHVFVDVGVAEGEVLGEVVDLGEGFAGFFHPVGVGGGLPGFDIGFGGVAKEAGEFGEGELFLIDEGGVPDGVEVGGFGGAEPADLDAVAALVVGLAGVEGLVKVTGEVEEEFEGFDALLFGSGGIAEGSFHLAEGGDDVAVGGFGGVVVGDAVGDVDVVPGVGFLIGGVGADFVGPVGGFGEGLGAEEVANGLEGFGGEMIFGDLAGDAMAGFAPTEEGDGGKEGDKG